MKWLLRLTGQAKKRTPLPPKPYIDTSNPGKHMSDPRYYDMNDLSNIDPEKPHWQDPRFESRQQTPFFDVFGFNRDWSYSMFKVSALLFVGVGYWEVRNVVYNTDEAKITSASTVSPVPQYARDNKTTEEELRKAGFAYVGVKELDHLGVVTKKVSSNGS